MKMDQLPLQLLQIALGARSELSQSFSDAEWDDCFQFADRQAVMGVMWAGVERLPQHQMPYLDLKMDWYGMVDYLRSKSDSLDIACRKVVRSFNLLGFDCVILKGQGIAQLYKQYPSPNAQHPTSITQHPSPNTLLRTPGDIDCWLFADRDAICQCLRDHAPGYTGEHEGELHTEFKYIDKSNPICSGTTVEVHFTATTLKTPRYSRRLKEWLDTQHPTLDFNLVYLILHMYRHYLFEGIGLRHVIDYYIVLSLSTDSQKQQAYNTLKWLGADKFAAALMYVLKDGMQLPADTWLCQPDQHRGRMLLSAIIKGGNFGKADKTNSTEYRQWGIKRLWRFAARNTLLFFAYPSEIGWHTARRIFMFWK